MNIIQPDWAAPANITAFTTLRHSWGNKNSNPKDKQTRLEFKNTFNLPTDPVWLNQTHSSIVVEALPENQNHIADASYATQSNQICIVTTADCLPLLVCNKQGSHVAAIHAGWRGLAAGIIESTLDALKVPAKDLLVWLGPAIGSQKFEVGSDVYAAFTEKHKESTSAFTAISNQKWLASLYELAKIRLREYGITQISGGDFCTYSQEDLFFSYRRNKEETGRIASLIWINSLSDKK